MLIEKKKIKKEKQKERYKGKNRHIDRKKEQTDRQ